MSVCFVYRHHIIQQIGKTSEIFSDDFPILWKSEIHRKIWSCKTKLATQDMTVWLRSPQCCIKKCDFSEVCGTTDSIIWKQRTIINSLCVPVFCWVICVHPRYMELSEILERMVTDHLVKNMKRSSSKLWWDFLNAIIPQWTSSSIAHPILSVLSVKTDLSHLFCWIRFPEVRNCMTLYHSSAQEILFGNREPTLSL